AGPGSPAPRPRFLPRFARTSPEPTSSGPRNFLSRRWCVSRYPQVASLNRPITSGHDVALHTGYMSAIDPEPPHEVDVLESFRGLALHDHGDPRAAARDVHRQLSTFLMEYKFALDEVEVKINILREEFELDHDYSPIEHVKSRLK